jgi:catechol 2,3-dioxygenase-like lactoylglutathione lyase family enzyme
LLPALGHAPTAVLGPALHVSAFARVRQTRVVIGRWHGLVIDCPDPRKLASFYEALLGMIRVQDDPSWVVIGDAPDRPGIAFQAAPGHTPPRWPAADSAQQMHIDVRGEDFEAAEAGVTALGAQRLDGGSDGFRVYRDPAGHPFCLVKL